MSFCYNCPLILVTLLILWSYYVYSYIYCFVYIESVACRVVFLVFYNIFFVFFLWCLWAASQTRMYGVPFQYKVSQRDHAILMQQNEADRHRILEDVCIRTGLRIYTRTTEGYIRYCPTCLNIKPDRTHHCSVCGMCVLKMDHHCPFLNNCIGLSNYKQFLLMLFYGFLYTLYIFGSTIPIFIDFCVGKRTVEKKYLEVQIITASLLAFLMTEWFNYYLCRHLVLVLKNQTTIETKYAPLFENHAMTFDISPLANFTAAFGQDPCLWLFPIPTIFDQLADCEFPVREIEMDDQPTNHFTCTAVLPCLCSKNVQ